MSGSEIIIYQNEDGSTKIDVRMEDETVWLSLDQMADLFQRDKSTISRHIKNIFEEGEVRQESVVANFATTAADGKTYQVDYYNLDVIISVGYRVKSLRGTQFRRWALNVLREYLIKGFAMNDDLLKAAGGGTYWKELLARIRDIRSSEKVFYRQVLDIYATSVDYDPRSVESVTFFKTVQNKIHFAVHGNTAAEVIYNRVDGDKPFAGLTSWGGNRPVIEDALIAKNYLSRDEINAMNRIVMLYLEFAEMQAEARVPMYMKDWIEKLDAFIKLSGKALLYHAGKISRDMAETKARTEYAKYRERTKDELSPVERDFLESMKQAEKRVGGKNDDC
jgi:hypothetical protein